MCVHVCVCAARSVGGHRAPPCTLIPFSPASLPPTVQRDAQRPQQALQRRRQLFLGHGRHAARLMRVWWVWMGRVWIEEGRRRRAPRLCSHAVHTSTQHTNTPTHQRHVHKGVPVHEPHAHWGRRLHPLPLLTTPTLNGVHANKQAHQRHIDKGVAVHEPHVHRARRGGVQRDAQRRQGVLCVCQCVWVSVCFCVCVLCLCARAHQHPTNPSPIIQAYHGHAQGGCKVVGGAKGQDSEADAARRARLQQRARGLVDSAVAACRWGWGQGGWVWGGTARWAQGRQQRRRQRPAGAGLKSKASAPTRTPRTARDDGERAGAAEIVQRDRLLHKRRRVAGVEGAAHRDLC